MANISPIFKKGSKNCRENYRPIFLTSIVCKIDEKIVRNRFMQFWHDSDLFYGNQFAYLEGRSKVTELLSSINDRAWSRTRCISTNVVFLDFDGVPHERLLPELYAN